MTEALASIVTCAAKFQCIWVRSWDGGVGGGGGLVSGLEVSAPGPISLRQMGMFVCDNTGTFEDLLGLLVFSLSERLVRIVLLN